MANVTISRDNFDDYRASMFFRALNVADAKFTRRVVTLKKSGEQVPLLHIEGVQTSTGLIVNFDIWPRNHATAEDIEKKPNIIGDFVFRIGHYETLDENGEKTTIDSQPKMLGYYVGNDFVQLSGEKRVYGEDSVESAPEITEVPSV